MNRQTELEGKGWARQNMIDEPRLSELVENYKALGLEVHLEPVNPDEENIECFSCLETDIDRYRIIYTRPSKGAVTDNNDELF